MEINNIIFISTLAFALLWVVNAEKNDAKETTAPSFNPLEDLILHQHQNEIKKEPLSRVKRQYYGGPYYGSDSSESIESGEVDSYEDEGRYYPGYYPVPIVVGFGGGFGGRGFGGRGFGGRGGGRGGGGFGGGGFGGGGFGGGGFGGGGFGGGRGGGGGGGRG